MNLVRSYGHEVIFVKLMNLEIFTSNNRMRIPITVSVPYF